jgi:twitching motility protein PilT
VPLKDARRIPPEEIARVAFGIMNEYQKEKYKQTNEVDLAYGVPGLGRFRVNIFQQRGTLGVVLRVIPFKIQSMEQLMLPKVLEKIAAEQRGLVLVTGTTGSGKSTTLAAMVDLINRTRSDHLITIEDPIEFVHQHQSCLVNQREVHQDTGSFGNALRAALREDPDIVLIGEMRDLETVEAALRIAETGHLTLATLHTNSAAQTINRIIDIFPSHQQSQIRTQLSLVLEGIVCQALLPKVGGGRTVALEIMIPNPAIRNLIRDDKVHQIYSAMQTGQEKLGMQTMNQSLATLYQKKLITLEAAMEKSSNRDELQEMISRGVGVVAGAGLGRPGMPPRPAVGR